MKEFKPKDPKAIDLGDDGEVNFEFGASKKKRKTQEELRREAEAKKAEEDAKLSYKGKPSSFFIMDFQQGDTRDPTG